MATENAGLRITGRRATVELALWTVVVSLAVLDVATTSVGLWIGFPEANPLFATAIEMFGLGGLALLKVVYLLGAFFVWQKTQSEGRVYVLFAATILLGLIVTNNLLVLTGVLA